MGMRDRCASRAAIATLHSSRNQIRPSVVRREDLSITPSTITIAGAGSVGCYVGGCLALAGHGVTLFGRPDLMHAIALNGLRITDCDGRDETVAPGRIATTTDPQTALGQATTVIVTVKSDATAEMARLIARRAPSGSAVVSFQNGTGNAAALREVLGTTAQVIAGMVPFNILQMRDDGDVPHMHRATSGRIHIAQGSPRLAAQLNVKGAPIVAHRDMTAVAWGKLILNLNNALNALSGLPLKQELADRQWRLILAAQAKEALEALRANGLSPARIDGINPRLMPFGLRLPDFMFRIVARPMLAVDPLARSSMWEDLERRRKTEIDHLQGAIIALANKAGTAATVNTRVRDLIRDAENAGSGSPGLTPAGVANGLIDLT
jgi:2-dehydropantoate 2-reductase